MKKAAMTTAPILAAAFLGMGLGGCGLTDLPLKLDYDGSVPEALSDGWQVSTPEAEGFDAVALEAVYRDLFVEEHYPTVQSLLVVRHGKLVAEAYTRAPSDRARLHDLQSATKTVTSLLLGIALDKGLVSSVDQLVFDFIPEHFDDDPLKREITLRHALSMKTGLAFDNDEHTEELFWGKGSSLDFVLHRNMDFAPGARFYYHDGNPQLVSGVIQKVSGKTEEQFGRDYLFGPLGITDFRWDHHADGSTFGAFGLWLRPRDMARIGLMVARGGVWEGRRIVSAGWLAESVVARNDEGDYGYYWWLRPGNAFMAEGHGGQIIYVSKAQDLVVVITADPYSSMGTLSPDLWQLPERVGAALAG